MRKLNPLKEKTLELSNDTFWYLTQGQEPICDPQECADELEDIYTMFPYGFEIGKYSANPDGTYDITFWPYEEVPDTFSVDYFWNMTKESQLQVHLRPTGLRRSLTRHCLPRLWRPQPPTEAQPSRSQIFPP